MIFGRKSKATPSPTQASEHPTRRQKKAAKSAERLVDTFVDVATLEGTTIRRKDGRYAALIESDGEPFGLMSPEEQDRRIGAYARILDGLTEGWELQVTVMVEPTDLSGVLQDLEQASKRLGDRPLARIADAEHDLASAMAESIMAQTVLLTVSAPTSEQARDLAQRLVNGMTQDGFTAKMCDADRLGTILQVAYGHAPIPLNDILGGWSAVLRRPVRAPDSPAKSEAVGGIKLSDHGDSAGLHASVPRLLDILRPPALIESPGQLDLGGTYATTFAVAAYPERAINGWMDRMIHFQYGRVRRRMSWHIAPIPTPRAVAEINRHLVDMDANARWANRRGLRPDTGTEMGIEGAEMMRDQLARGAQRMFEVRCLITLLADDPETLRAAATRFRDDARGSLLPVRELYLDQVAGFRATIPLGVYPLRRTEPDTAKRPLPTLVIATTFPFTAGEYLDPHGDLWGQNLATGNAVVVDPSEVDPGHMIVVAPTGSGKSFGLKVLATQALLREDEDVLVLDPSEAIDYERWAWVTGASYIRFGPGARARVNPLEILLPLNPDTVDDDMQRPVSGKVAFLTVLFGMMAYPDSSMPPEERARLERPLYQLYADFGMTDEWSSIRAEQGLSLQARAKPSPTLADALRAIEGTPGLESLAVRLAPYVQGSLDMFSGATTVDMSKRAVVFNVHALTQGAAADHLQAVSYAIISEFIRWRIAAQNRRVLVMIDEAHVMFRRSDTAKLVSQLFRMARKANGRVALITQGIVDLLGDPATMVPVPGQVDAKSCLDNSGLRLFLRNDNLNDLRLIQSTFQLTEAEIRMISSAHKGQGLLMAGNKHGPKRRAYVHIESPEALYPWITSDPAEVAQFQADGVYDEMLAEKWAASKAAASARQDVRPDAPDNNTPTYIERQA